MIAVEVQRHITAPPETVWPVYTDWCSWTDWARLGRVRLSRAGAPDRNGVGAIRSINNFGHEVHEEIVGFEPPHRVVYRVVGGLVPMRDHEGEVILEPEGGGTRVTWRCHFVPTLPGTGPAMRALVGGIFSHALRGLQRRMTR